MNLSWLVDRPTQLICISDLYLYVRIRSCASAPASKTTHVVVQCTLCAHMHNQSCHSLWQQQIYIHCQRCDYLACYGISWHNRPSSHSFGKLNLCNCAVVELYTVTALAMEFPSSHSFFLFLHCPRPALHAQKYFQEFWGLRTRGVARVLLRIWGTPPPHFRKVPQNFFGTIPCVSERKARPCTCTWGGHKSWADRHEIQKAVNGIWFGFLNGTSSEFWICSEFYGFLLQCQTNYTHWSWKYATFSRWVRTLGMRDKGTGSGGHWRRAAGLSQV